ncbi:MAG: hypothetical protein ACXQT4_03270 [Methanotrichaceae archaeon]
MKKRSLIIFLIICMCLLGCACGKIGPGGTHSSGSSGGSSTGGDSGGGRHIVNLDLEDLIKAAEKWKNEDPDDFDYLKTLFAKPFVTTTEYKLPSVFIHYPSNETTIYRNDKLDISAYLWNSNPIEIRRVLYLTLEMKKEGETEFKPITEVQKIQTNEYDKEHNFTSRSWPEISSVRDLEAIGNVTLRIRFQDGQFTYYSSNMSKDLPNKDLFREINLDVVNNPPEITNMSVSPGSLYWKDPVEYVAIVKDPDSDKVDVTLHVLDENGNELANCTQTVIPGRNGSQITFTNAEYNFFDENAADKNFTYRYSYSDGIDSNNTTIMLGPYFRPDSKIRVGTSTVEPVGGAHYYYWQGYDFGLKVQNPDINGLAITLYTDTPANPRKKADSREIDASEDFVIVNFSDVKPFTVSDCNQSFSYYFSYSVPDQNGRYSTGLIPGEKINPKILRYSIHSPVMVANIFAVLLIALVFGIVIERRLYR